MPIYEYICKKCDARFDHLAKSMSESGKADKVKCPECNSAKTERAMSVFAVGSGPARSSAPASPCERCGEAGGCPMRGS